MILNKQKIKIMEEFLRDYTAKITGSYIAKKNRLNQKSVSNFLRDLEKENFLKNITQGKNKLYFLNLEDELVIISFISYWEHIRIINFYRKNPLIKEVISKVIPHCSNIVIIFGSYAKGIEKDDSDLDLFIVGKYNDKEIEKISNTYKIDINVKYYPKMPEKRDSLIEEIIKDHLIANYVEQFVKMVFKWKKSNGAFA